jgi:ribose transport system substrate-binding protein
MGIRISPTVVRSLLAVTVLLVVAWAGSESQAQTFQPRPQGGISGALLPNERHLWTYDFKAGKYVEVPGDASGEYKPNLRKPGKPLTFAFAEGWAAIPFSVSINKGIYRIARDLGINIFATRNLGRRSRDLRRAIVAAKPDFTVVSG